MEAGKRDKLLTLKVPTHTQAGDGSMALAYTTLTTVWGNIKPLSGREYWAAQQTQAELTHEITIPYRAGMRPDMRLYYGSRVFHVLSYFSPDENRADLVLRCKEVVSVGN